MSAADHTDPPGTAVSNDLAPVLAAVGARLRALRRNRGATLDDLSADTGIWVSTLSRLESGQRRLTLELLLPLARAHQWPWTSSSVPRPPETLGSARAPPPGTA